MFGFVAKAVKYSSVRFIKFHQKPLGMFMFEY